MKRICNLDLDNHVSWHDNHAWHADIAFPLFRDVFQQNVKSLFEGELDHHEQIANLIKKDEHNVLNLHYLYKKTGLYIFGHRLL